VTHVHPISPSGGPAEPITVPVVLGTGNASQRLDRLSPLIHQLLAWDLIYRSDTGTYLLREDVQQRLVAMESAAAPPTAEVYLGRKCQSCGSIRATRLVEGVRVCELCRLSASVVPPALPDAVPTGSEHHGIRSRWHRKAS
jgi:hypothetical protein